MFSTLAWPFLQWAQLCVELLRFVLIPPSDDFFSISLLVYQLAHCSPCLRLAPIFLPIFLFCINSELAGIGGGGIVSAVWVITSEVVDVRQRATWSQALSVTWSCSAIAGPLIGGIFSGTFFHILPKRPA
jgi:MFS family permease